MSLPRDMVLFDSIGADCTGEILRCLNGFDQTSLAVTSKYFAGAVAEYKNTEQKSKLYARLKQMKIFDSILQIPTSQHVDLLLLFAEGDCDLGLLRWEAMLSYYSEDSHIISVTVKNLAWMKLLAEKVYEIGLEPGLIEILELSELNIPDIADLRDLRDLIVNRVFAKSIYIFAQKGMLDEDNGSWRLPKISGWSEAEYQLAKELFKRLLKEFKNNFSCIDPYLNDLSRKTLFVASLEGQGIPAGFVQLMMRLNENQCLNIVFSRSRSFSEMTYVGQMVLSLMEVGVEAGLIEWFLQKSPMPIFSNRLDQNQMHVLKEFIVNHPAAINSYHKIVLFFHLSKIGDFEKNKEVYTRYIDSVAGLDLHAELSMQITRLLKYAFSYRFDSLIGEFLDTIIIQSFYPIDFWHFLLEKYSDDPKIIFFAAILLAGNKSYNNEKILAVLNSLYDYHFDDVAPSKFRDFLRLGDNGLLKVNKNHFWFEDLYIKRSSNMLAGDSRALGAFLNKVVEDSKASIRLNQLTENEVAFWVLVNHAKVGYTIVELCVVLLNLPDKLFNLLLAQLPQLVEFGRQENFKLAEQLLWFLKPFHASSKNNYVSEFGLLSKEGVSQLNRFFAHLSTEQFNALVRPPSQTGVYGFFAQMITGLHNQNKIELSTIIFQYCNIESTFGLDMANLYLRFVELVLQTSQFDKFAEFSKLLAKHKWVNKSDDLSFFAARWPKYIRVELTRLVDELLNLQAAASYQSRRV